MDESLIIAECAKLAPGKVLVLEGYVSSDGGVTNMELLALPDNGYHTLVKESVEALLKETITPSEEDDADLFAQALSEVSESLRKTLAGETAARSNNIEYTTENGVLIKDASGKDRAVVVRSLKAISSTRVKPPSKTVNSKPLTLLKDSIRKRLPVGSYVGMVTLSPSKVTSVLVKDA